MDPGYVPQGFDCPEPHWLGKSVDRGATVGSDGRGPSEPVRRRRKHNLRGPTGIGCFQHRTLNNETTDNREEITGKGGKEKRKLSP